MLTFVLSSVLSMYAVIRKITQGQQSRNYRIQIKIIISRNCCTYLNTSSLIRVHVQHISVVDDILEMYSSLRSGTNATLEILD